MSFLRLLKLDFLYIIYSCLLSSCCDEDSSFVAFLQKSLAGVPWHPLTRRRVSAPGCPSRGVLKARNDLHLRTVTYHWGYFYENRCLQQLLHVGCLCIGFFFFFAVSHPLLWVSAGGSWASQGWWNLGSHPSSLVQGASPWSKQAVTVTEDRLAIPLLSWPRSAGGSAPCFSKMQEKEEFQSTKWDPAMRSLREDWVLKSWVTVKLLFQRSRVRERRRFLASGKEMRCLSKNQ